MRNFFCTIFLIVLLSLTASLVSCKQDLKTNQFNIYVSQDNPGWHFVDVTYDTIHKGHHRITVKFDKGQKFQQVQIRSDLKNYHPTFLFSNGDTARTELWFTGEYTYDPLQRKFFMFYMPNYMQSKTVEDYLEYPGYDSLRYEMDTVVENYLRKRGEIK